MRGNVGKISTYKQVYTLIYIYLCFNSKCMVGKHSLHKTLQLKLFPGINAWRARVSVGMQDHVRVRVQKMQLTCS